MIVHGQRFKLLYRQEEISARIAAIGRELGDRYQQLNPLVIGVLNGASIFHADLVRALPGELEIGFVRTRSYTGMKSTQEVEITWIDDPSVLRNRHVVIVEDIVDTGRTLAALCEAMNQLGAASLLTVVLLNKPHAREVPCRVDLVGFEIDDRFVIGFGLDYDGIGRNLPSIYQLHDDA